MATRYAAACIPRSWRPTIEKLARITPRYFSDAKGRVLGEEERAIENVYIQKMERERMEKRGRKEKERLEAGKANSEKVGDMLRMPTHTEVELFGEFARDAEGDAPLLGL